MYIVSILKSLKIIIHALQKASIILLNIKKINILRNYSDFNNIFLSNSATKLFKQGSINNYLMNLVNNKQIFYSLIYSLELIKLATLKTYIKINLANGFIQLSKSLTSALILFVHKKDRSFYFYINCYSLNNLTINIQYLLPLIKKFLDFLSQVNCFTQLKLTNKYYKIEI